MDKILVIIVTYNAMEWVERCFSSVRNSSISVDMYVVDNGSSDGTQDYILKHYPEVHFTQSDDNLGFGKANNIGLQYAIDKNYDYVYLLNQDAWIYNDTIESLISIHKQNSEYGILSPFQLQANSGHLDNNFYLHSCSGEKCKLLFDDLYFNRIKDVYPVSMVMAAHWLLSIDCIKQVGGFSPTFPQYGEDNNYADRVLYHNFKIGIVPKSYAIHDRESRIDNKQKKIYLSHINNLIILSNIYSKNSLYLIIYNTIRTIVYNKTIQPFKNLMKILLNVKRIKKNRFESKQECAFLNNSQKS